jgi:apolipoprotein N-acyltransferase
MKKFLYPTLLGALLPLAFAPKHWLLLVILIPGLYEALLQKTKQPALTGFLFGVGFFGVGASWIFVSIHEFSDSPLWVALVITLGFISILSAELALSAWIYRRLKPESFKQRLLIFPPLWALTEAFRGWFLTGFPWLYLGDTIVSTPLRGFLPLLGVMGVSWLLVTLSLLLIKSWRYTPVLLGTVFLGYALSLISWTHPSGQEYRVSLVQGNIPQLTKWDPKQAHAHFERYYDLTKTVLDSEIIIWPEASLPIPMPYGTPYQEALTELITPHHHTLVIGELVSEGGDGYLNSAQVLGNGDHRYDKKHLVPFGEYLPFYDLLGPLLDQFKLPTPTTRPGTAHQVPLIVGEWRAAMMICYEIAYPFLTLHAAQDSDVLITISNDTWFGHSFGPQQHFQIARTRAIETGRYLLRATNNGVTGFIGPQGEVLAKAPQFVATTLTATIPGMQGRTPLMIYGQGLILILGLISIVIGFKQRPL